MATVSDAALMTVTETATEKITAHLDEQGMDNVGIRIAIQGRTANAFQYHMGFQTDEGANSTDTVVDCGKFKVYVDAKSAENLQGAKLDFVENLQGSGFEIDNPNKPVAPTWDDPIAAKIQELLDSEINPAVASHGGMIELVDVKANKAYVRLSGGCQGCARSRATLKEGVETRIRQLVPQITEVVDTTDHTDGENPYY